MYTYEYESVSAKVGILTVETENYREIITRRAKEGWRYIGFVPVLQTGHGIITKMDLIFEKEM